MKSGALGVRAEFEVPIRMRDGVTLRANVFRPDGAGSFPALLLRTPYGKSREGYDRIVRSGYAVVAQDSRGRYASDGDYTPFTSDNTGDAEDGYDTIEWLPTQPWCNGKVGTFGKSYDAWMQWKQAALRPPHLLAMCAWTIPLELTEVDWPGVFRPGRRLRWWFTSMAPDLRRRAGMSPPHTKIEANRIWNEIEHGRWLGLMPIRSVSKYLPPRLAQFVEEWFDEPWCKPWQFESIHSEIDVPNLDVSGYYDHCCGSMAHLALMQNNARTERARSGSQLIVGPWNHGGLGNRAQGDLDFGPQVELDLELMMIRWFDHWLKGEENGIDRDPPVRYFVMGANEWRSASTWPPPNCSEQAFYFGADFSLGREPPKETGLDQFSYDPVDPVPTLWTRDLFTVPSDRRTLDYRDDILRYRSGVLESDVEAVGYCEVVLFVSSSAVDTDFFAHLVDEIPEESSALEVSSGMVRGRYREGVDREQLLVPGEIYEITIRLTPTACMFQKGHRIRLEITSSNFPNYDRNHNTGGDDLSETELKIAEQSIYRGVAHPSRIIIKSDVQN